MNVPIHIHYTRLIKHGNGQIPPLRLMIFPAKKALLKLGFSIATSKGQWHITYGGLHKWGIPQNRWFTWENPHLFNGWWLGVYPPWLWKPPYIPKFIHDFYSHVGITQCHSNKLSTILSAPSLWVFLAPETIWNWQVVFLWPKMLTTVHEYPVNIHIEIIWISTIFNHEYPDIEKSTLW